MTILVYNCRILIIFSFSEICKQFPKVPTACFIAVTQFPTQIFNLRKHVKQTSDIQFQLYAKYSDISQVLVKIKSKHLLQMCYAIHTQSPCRKGRLWFH